MVGTQPEHRGSATTSVSSCPPAFHEGRSRRRLTEASLALGAALVVLFGLLITLHSLVFVVGGSLYPAVTVLAVLATFAGLWFLFGAGAPLPWVVVLAALVVVLVAVVLLSAATVDISYGREHVPQERGGG